MEFLFHVSKQIIRLVIFFLKFNNFSLTILELLIRLCVALAVLKAFFRGVFLESFLSFLTYWAKSFY